MFDVGRIVRQVAGFVGGTFGAVWAALAPLVAAFRADLAAGEQALVSAAAAAVAGLVAWAWQLVAQLRERAHEVLAPSLDEVQALADEIAEKVEELRAAVA